MEFLLHKNPNKNGYYNYQRNVGKHIECGCFKTFEDGILYAKQEGYENVKFEGQKFIVLRKD